MIIASVTGPRMEQALAQARATAPDVHLLEYRLDLIRSPVTPTLLAATPRPAVITVRPRRQGGAYVASERERLAMLEQGAAEGAAFIDVEYDVSPGVWQRLRERYPRTRLIASRHLLRAQGFSVRTMYRSLADTGADVVKFAFVARDACDLLLVREFLALATRDRRKAVCLAMGEAGEASRVLYRVFGGWATYGSARDGQPAAPGQIPAEELSRVYRADRLTRRARIFGVVGMPLAQSKGMYMHNAAFGRRDAVYCRFPVSRLSLFFRSVVPLLRGFSVTLPHKVAVIRYLDRLDPVTAAIGAVNTVVRRGGKLVGRNTDAAGALDAIETTGRVRGKTLLVVGAGGAARAVAYEAKRRGAVVLITNRHAGRARRLAKEVGGRDVLLKDIRRVSFDILANTTPAGMAPDLIGLPVPSTVLAGKVVFDAVYNPPLTRLLREARDRGSRIVPGTAMYINQAAEQSRLYTGRRPSLQVLRRALLRHLPAAR